MSWRIRSGLPDHHALVKLWQGELAAGISDAQSAYAIGQAIENP